MAVKRSEIIKRMRAAVKKMRFVAPGKKSVYRLGFFVCGGEPKREVPDRVI